MESYGKIHFAITSIQVVCSKTFNFLSLERKVKKQKVLYSLTDKDHDDFIVHTQLYTIVEAAEILLNNWSDDEDNFADVVILPPDKIDSMTDDKEIDANAEKLGSPFAKDVTGPIEIHSNTALRDIESTKSSQSEPTYNEQGLSLGKKKKLVFSASWLNR